MHGAARQQALICGVSALIRTVSIKQAASPCFAEAIGLASAAQAPKQLRPPGTILMRLSQNYLAGLQRL